MTPRQIFAWIAYDFGILNALSAILLSVFVMVFHNVSETQAVLIYVIGSNAILFICVGYMIEKGTKISITVKREGEIIVEH